MRKLFFIFFSIAVSLPAAAQHPTKNRMAIHKQPADTLEAGIISFHKQFVFGIKLISDGYGIFLEKGYSHSIKKATLFQIDISERKSEKDQKQTNVLNPSASPFIYGKENFFYPIKLGVQQQILLGNKGNKNGVNITANYGGGLCLGLLRPYEMQVMDSATGTPHYIKYNSADSSLFMTPNDPGPPVTSDPFVPGFLGGPGLGQGWNNLSVVPGLYAKAALRFDHGRSGQIVSAIEVGIDAEYYTQKVPLIVNTTPKQFFLSAYASIAFGKRK